MANYTAYYIVLRAQAQIQDESGVMISQEEILREVNSGQMEIVSLIPTAYSKKFIMSLVGGTRQTLPSDCLNILAPVRNMGTTGSTPGRAVRQFDRQALDSFDPEWHTTAGSSVITGISYDENTPNQFLVYPPATAGTTVELEGSFAPPIIVYDEDGAWQTEFLSIRDQYVEALFEFVMYRVYSKDSESPSNEQEAQKHWSLFQAMLGMTPPKRKPSVADNTGRSV